MWFLFRSNPQNMRHACWAHWRLSNQGPSIIESAFLPYLNLLGEPTGFKNARSSSMSWSLILRTFSGLKEETEISVAVACGRACICVCMCVSEYYVSFARSELPMTRSKLEAALRKLATARLIGSGKETEVTCQQFWWKTAFWELDTNFGLGRVGHEIAYPWRYSEQGAGLHKTAKQSQGSPPEPLRSHCSLTATPDCRPDAPGRSRRFCPRPGGCGTLRGAWGRLTC